LANKYQSSTPHHSSHYLNNSTTNAVIFKRQIIITMRFLVASCIVCIAVYSCKQKKEPPKTDNKPPATVVDVIVAGTQSLSNTIETNGTVIPFESVELKPEVAGRLTYLNINEGNTVAKGTVLAKINDADLQAQLYKTQVQLQLAQTTEARLKKLLAIQGVNQADYDNALNQVNSFKADLGIIQAQIDKTILKAPFNGVLGLRMVSPGAYVTSASILGTLQQTNQVKIDFSVPEQFIRLVKKGATVKVLATENNQTYTATIIAEEAAINQTTRNLKVRALLQNGNLNAGAFVKVFLNNNQQQQSIIVPTNAIIPDAKEQKIVLVKNGKGIIKGVETGIRTAGGVQITQGLQVGDSVVVTGVLFVRPNSDVKVRSVKNIKDLL
jgi:membrane fusion protein, multidrug efflux system